MQRFSMGCPALPLCGLAIGEAERGLPDISNRIRALMNKLDFGPDEHFHIRMTGCPNGCTRPYMAELGFVADGPNSYQVWLGGTSTQTRLAEPFMERMKVQVSDYFASFPLLCLSPVFVDREGCLQQILNSPSRLSSTYGEMTSQIRSISCFQHALCAVLEQGRLAYLHCAISFHGVQNKHNTIPIISRLLASSPARFGSFWQPACWLSVLLLKLAIFSCLLLT